MQKKYIVRLTDVERETLRNVIKKLKGSSLKVRRAQVLLKADVEGAAWTDRQIAEAFGCRTKTVENIRQRLVTEGFEATLDGKRPTTPTRAPVFGGETRVRDQRTKVDWAQEVEELLRTRYAGAEKVILVCDNLNTHTKGAFYEAFEPEKARAIVRRLEFRYTPKHGSWLNMAETELGILSRQCLDRRIEDREKLPTEIAVWETDRNDMECRIHWHFTTSDARTKLQRLYPVIQPVK